MNCFSPPTDQLVVDEFFQLLNSRPFKKTTWLYGMVSTYGLKPEELKGFTWNDDNTINVIHKKRPIRPLHPQWVSLFQLKKKQPSKIEGCLDKMIELFYSFISSRSARLNLTDLLLGYRMRKKFYAPIKTQRVQKEPCLAAS
jgi:hypothetical protein